MKSSDWLWVGLGAVVIYFAWKARAAVNLNWTLQNASIQLNGLSAQINATMIVTNSSTANVSLTNVNCTLIYNGTVLGTAGLSQTIVPGNNSVTIPFVVSDLTILNNIIGIADGNVDSTQFQIKGSGLIDGVPGTFTATYSLPI